LEEARAELEARLGEVQARIEQVLTYSGGEFPERVDELAKLRAQEEVLRADIGNNRVTELEEACKGLEAEIAADTAAEAELQQRRADEDAKIERFLSQRWPDQSWRRFVFPGKPFPGPKDPHVNDQVRLSVRQVEADDELSLVRNRRQSLLNKLEAHVREIEMIRGVTDGPA